MIDWIRNRIISWAIKKALYLHHKYEWSEDNQKDLENFMLSTTGAKLMAHLDSVLQAMLLDAASEEESAKALHKMATAKGFSLAIGAIKLSMPPQLPEEVVPETIDPFVSTKSQPTIY